MGTKRQSVSSPRTYAVLCVDDHEAGLKIRKIFLESFGYSVTTAPSGPAALELAAQHPFDAVVLDYRMPGMNGLELAKSLREHFPALPLIVLSGYASELPTELHELASGFVPKGSHPQVLLTRLEEVLGGAPRKRAPRRDMQEVLSRAQQHLEESKRQMERAKQVTSPKRQKRSRSA